MAGPRGRSMSASKAEDAAKPWLCVVPRDAQEGDEIAIDRHDFDLIMGQAVAFPLASSSVRPQDKAGDLVATDPDSILNLPPLVGHMRVGRKAKSDRVPVRIAARVTETGDRRALVASPATDERRSGGSRSSSGRPAVTRPPLGPDDRERGPMPLSSNSPRSTPPIESIRSAFAAPAGTSDGGPARLIKRLEEVLDSPREAWPPSALRALWEPLRDSAEARNKGPRHESRWYNLAGFALRPGRRLPARRGPDQSPLADVPPGGEARQGPPVLGRLVGSSGDGSPPA